MKFKYLLPIVLFITPTVFAFENNDNYFRALDQITKPPKNSAPILACSPGESKQIRALLHKDFGGDQVNVYKGDFSNEGAIEYAVVTTGGTMHVNTVSIYKLSGRQLVDTKFEQTIIANLIPGSDMSHFYYHVAKPFAVVMNGKTYLRFMDYPGGSRDYDKSKLQLCTYLWRGNKIQLTGPNWGFASRTSNLSYATNCIGA